METTLKNNGYAVEGQKEDGIIATKDKNRFFIRRFQISTNRELVSQMEILKKTNHHHIVNAENSFQDQDMYYVVMEDCQGGTLAEKIRGMSEPLQELEALSLIVELCLALRTIQDKGLIQKHLTPQTIFLTESGMLRLGGFGKIQASAMADNTPEGLNYLPPETFTMAVYDSKSVIWSVGCILYELCTKRQAFSADTTVSLISRITSGPDPVPKGQFSSEFLELLSDMLSRNPDLRPTVQEILDHPIVLKCLLTKCKITTDHLQDQQDKLKGVADDLERIHWNTTVGSLIGGVIGAVGGITSIAGVLLAPVTLGASLAVAGVGAGVGLAGGITAGASNIIKAIKESSDRKAFKSIIEEFEEKINALTFWLQEIDNSLQMIRQHSSRYSEHNDNPEHSDFMFFKSTGRSAWEVYRLAQVARSGTTMTQISRAVQIAGTASARSAARAGQVARSGTTMAQISRVAQIAKTASAVFSGLFVAADVFFIVMDAKELNNIDQAGADGRALSEVMKFVESIRKAAVELQQVLDEFKSIITGIDTLYRTAMAIWGVNK